MKNKICYLTKCESCNSFNLYYNGVQMHISFKSMQHIISILYQYDCSDEKTKLEKPFRIKIEPVVLTVKNSDYIEFKSILENAIIENYNLPDFTHYKIFTN